MSMEYFTLVNVLVYRNVLFRHLKCTRRVSKYTRNLQNGMQQRGSNNSERVPNSDKYIDLNYSQGWEAAPVTLK